MANTRLDVAAKRLGSSLRDFKQTLRRTYASPNRQVASNDLKRSATALAETWLADISMRVGEANGVSKKYVADLNVHFQRLLLYAERPTRRKLYDKEIAAILKDFTVNLVVPVLQNPLDAAWKATKTKKTRGSKEVFRATAFVGHSFSDADHSVTQSFISILEAVGITVVTGEKPHAGKISEKVKQRLEAQNIFVGIFTKKDKLAGQRKWITSAWVIDEKAYAYGKDKKLILLKEADVDSIGGIQGDYEYIEFSRTNLHEAILKLLQLFAIDVSGMRD